MMKVAVRDRAQLVVLAYQTTGLATASINPGPAAPLPKHRMTPPHAAVEAITSVVRGGTVP